MIKACPQTAHDIRAPNCSGKRLKRENCFTTIVLRHASRIKVMFLLNDCIWLRLTDEWNIFRFYQRCYNKKVSSSKSVLFQQSILNKLQMSFLQLLTVKWMLIVTCDPFHDVTNSTSRPHALKNKGKSPLCITSELQLLKYFSSM